MAGLNNIKIDLADDAYEIFKATRIFHCQAIGCKFNSVNFDRASDHAECILKRVYIGSDGRCLQFEKAER